MPKVFISYRRDDTLAFTGRLHDKLAERFGSDQVFMDFDNIPFGSDFREHLHSSLETCDVLLAVIGPNWVGKVANANRSRLSDPADFVRLEIQVALERDVPIIPVLVGDASMPTEEELPSELEPLLYRQAAPVDMARDFHVHAERLIDGIERIDKSRTHPDSISPIESSNESARHGKTKITTPRGGIRINFLKSKYVYYFMFTTLFLAIFIYSFGIFESIDVWLLKTEVEVVSVSCPNSLEVGESGFFQQI